MSAPGHLHRVTVIEAAQALRKVAKAGMISIAFPRTARPPTKWEITKWLFSRDWLPVARINGATWRARIQARWRAL